MKIIKIKDASELILIDAYRNIHSKIMYEDVGLENVQLYLKSNETSYICVDFIDMDDCYRTISVEFHEDKNVYSIFLDNSVDACYEVEGCTSYSPLVHRNISTTAQLIVNSIMKLYKACTVVAKQ